MTDDKLAELSDNFAWTDDEAPGAIPNGTRVIKVDGEEEGGSKVECGREHPGYEDHSTV